MYEELIGLLRDYGRDCTGNDMCENCSIQHFCENGWTPSKIADAIEDLVKKLVIAEDESGLYDALPTVIIKEPQWISVEERLPETDNEVLTTYIVNGNKKKRYVETSRYYDNEEEGFWSSVWDEFRVSGTRIEVIAWMPLPEPPKEET